MAMLPNIEILPGLASLMALLTFRSRARVAMPPDMDLKNQFRGKWAAATSCSLARTAQSQIISQPVGGVLARA